MSEKQERLGLPAQHCQTEIWCKGCSPYRQIYRPRGCHHCSAVPPSCRDTHGQFGSTCLKQCCCSNAARLQRHMFPGGVEESCRCGTEGHG